MPLTDQLTLGLDVEIEETEESPLCETCEHTLDECNCYTCEGCDARVGDVCSTCDECDSCCNCVSCSSNRCDFRGESVCSNCERCSDCCECFYCEGCGERNSDGTCGDCYMCRGCCSCSESSNSESLYDGELVFHSAKRNEYARNPSKRFISLEIEVASGDGTQLHKTCRKYSDAIVEDGSLPDAGWELNMNPSQGDVFLDHVDAIADGLRDGEASVNSSCGMHCHVDARDFGWLDLFKLCKLYAKVEAALFQIVSPSRRGNRYCIATASIYNFADFKTFKADILESLYNWRPTAKKRVCGLDYGGAKSHKHAHGSCNVFSERKEKYNHARYRALNIHSFFYRGTVEFRHHQGSCNATRMQNWGMVCASILDAANTLTVSQIDALPLDSFDALQAILRPELQQWTSIRRSELGR